MIAHKKPFSMLPTHGVVQDTQACKNLLMSTPGQWFPNGHCGEGWKRTSKYGKPPLVYRIFKNTADIHALVVETSTQIAVVGISSDEHHLRDATLSKEILEAVGTPNEHAPALHITATKPSSKTRKSQDSRIAKNDWTQILHIEDQWTKKEIQARASIIQSDWIQRCEGMGGSEALYEMLEEWGFTNRSKKSYTAEELLNRKAIASLFSIAHLYNGNGDSDAEGASPASYHQGDMLGVFFEHPLIEPDLSPSMDVLFDHAFEDLNGSCSMGIDIDESVQDLDELVDHYTQTYVWLIERGFQTPNAPSTAKKIVRMRQEMRASAREQMVEHPHATPHP